MDDVNTGQLDGQEPQSNPDGDDQGTQVLVNEKGEFSENWRTQLGDEGVKNNAALDKFKTVEGIAKSYLSLEKMVGKDKISIPTDATSEEEMSDFYNKLGRPETAEGYKFDKAELPDGIPYDEELEKGFASKAHELGLSQKQAGELLNWYNGASIEGISQAEKANADAMVEAEIGLKKEWGNAYESKLAIANKAVRTFEAADELKRLGLHNNPVMVKMMSKIGEAISEDKLVGDSGTNMTPADAKSEIDSIMGDKKSPYFNSDHPQHKEFVTKVNKLYTQMNPV